MAESYVDKFRLINEPANHWEVRKKFLLRNWDDYPEMQIVSLSMVWANVQFDGCKYSAELMERVRDMAMGISAHPSSSHASETGSQKQSLSNPATSTKRKQPSDGSLGNTAKRPCFNQSKPTGTLGDERSEDCLSLVDVNGSPVTTRRATPLVSLYPSDPTPAKTVADKFDKLSDICTQFKLKCIGGWKEYGQLRSLLWALMNNPDIPNTIEYHDVSEGQKHNPKWKAYFIIVDALGAVHVAGSKKAAKDGAVRALVDLWKDCEGIYLRNTHLEEGAELGFNHEMVYLQGTREEAKDVLCEESKIESNQDMDIPSDCPATSKIITADSILQALPHEFAAHDLNVFLSAAPRLPNFILFESLEESAKFGYEHPIGKLVNSASRCKVPIEFAMDQCKIRKGKYGVVCTVFLCSHKIATGLALGTREAKHLAAHNAVQALKMTNTTIRKSATVEGPAISRHELTDGSAKEEALPETNVGHKLLKMMGWKGEGSGLGKKGEGIADPVKATGTGAQTKEGLGFDLHQLKDPNTKKLDRLKLWNFLQDYARSNRGDELVFSSELSVEERQQLHNMSLKLGLKSKSRGKGDNRFLTIGRKWDVTQLVNAVAGKGGSMGGYELVGPSL